MEPTYTAALATAHPDQLKDLETRKKAAEDQRLTDPAAGRVQLATLPPRITAVTNKSAGWKGPVANAVVATRAANFADIGAATTQAKALLADGGLTTGNIASLIPVLVNGNPVPNTFGASTKYPRGFKYKWKTANGSEMEIYGHGPSSGAGVDPDSISSKGNIVRILVGGSYLQSDGTTKIKSKTDKGHIPLFGNP